MEVSEDNKGKGEETELHLVMRAVLIQEGGIPYLSTSVERPKLDIDSDRVLVRVKYAAVNPLDWRISSGELKPILYPPQVPGLEASGIIVAKGKQVSPDLQIGDRVWLLVPGSFQYGTYGELILCEEHFLALMPSNLDFKQSASLPLASLSAYQILVTMANVKKNDRVLILGGSSGLGVIAIQVAKGLGAEIWTTCDSKDEKLMKSLGADYVIDHKTQNFVEFIGELKMYIVLDIIGDLVDRKSAFGLIKQSGFLVTLELEDPIHNISVIRMVQAIGQNLWDQITSRLWYGITYCNFQTNASLAKDNLDKIRVMVEGGLIRPVIDSEFDLEEVAQAWDRSKSARVQGKIVLRVES